MWGIKAYVGEEGRQRYSFNPFATSVPVRGCNQAPDVFTSAKKTRYTLYIVQETGWAQGRDWTATKKFLLNRDSIPCPSSPVASLYNHYTTLSDFKYPFLRWQEKYKANITQVTVRNIQSTALHIYPLPLYLLRPYLLTYLLTYSLHTAESFLRS